MRLHRFLALLCLSPALPAETLPLTVARTEHGAEVKIGADIFAAYVTDGAGATKPYLWPIYGPGQKLMTRAYPMENLQAEQHDHPHHRGIFFGHDDTGGFDTWAEPDCFPKALAGKGSEEEMTRLARMGRNRHRSFEKMEAREGVVTLVALSDHLDASGKKHMEERRTMVFSVVGEQRLIDVDIELTATDGPLTIADKKDGGLGLRLPTVLAADSKPGGVLVNSEGLSGKDVWGKRAKWCDAYGPLDGAVAGVALLNHPASFRYPTPWHARTYGLLAANPFGPQSLNPAEPKGDFVLEPGKPLKLFHRFLFHSGDVKAAKIAEAWEAYARLPKN